MEGYYFFQRDYWVIGVNAISEADARQHIKTHALGAKFNGFHYPTKSELATATGMVTAKRQEQIHEEMLDLVQEWNERKLKQEVK